MKIYKQENGTEYICVGIKWLKVAEIIEILEKHRDKLLGICVPENLCIEITDREIMVRALENFFFASLFYAKMENNKDRIHFIKKLKKFFDEAEDGIVFDEHYEQLSIDGFFDEGVTDNGNEPNN